MGGLQKWSFLALKKNGTKSAISSRRCSWPGRAGPGWAGDVWICDLRFNNARASREQIHPENQWVIETPGDFPHDLHFDPVTGYLWFQSMQQIPVAADEQGNTEIPCAITVYNLDAGEVVKRLGWDYGLWHVSLAPDNKAYASGSFHTVVVYDRQTYEKVEEVRDGLGTVGAPQPIMEIDF